jgi:hypothetical protein
MIAIQVCGWWRNMGTRSEIYVRCLESENANGRVIELYKHHDGHPKYMIPHISRFATWARRMVKDQLHWLLYPEDVASLLIAYDFMIAKRHWRRVYGNTYGVKANIKPDIRPRGSINDYIDYAYVIDVCEELKKELAKDMWVVTWRLKAFEVGLGNMDNVRKAVREGTEDSVSELKLIKVKTIKIKGTQSPILMF